jgi:hypothetical protein
MESIIVVAYRSEATIPATIASIGAATSEPFELIVVDNAPTGAVADAVQRLAPGALVIECDANVGYAAGVNRGLAVARGERVLLLNPDATLRPGSLDRLRHALDELPAAGIVAPAIVDRYGRTQVAGHSAFTLTEVFRRHARISRARAVDGDAPRAVDWAQGACLLIRTDLLRRLGGLDERFFLYCDDVDLCLRARRRGWLTYVVPDARVTHDEGSSSRQVVPLKLASHYYSKVAYFAKHGTMGQRLALRGMLAADLALRVIVRRVQPASTRPVDVDLRVAMYREILGNLVRRSDRAIQREWLALTAHGGG